MAGKTHIEIQEFPQQLEKLMKEQKASRKFIRVQCLHLLKTGKAATITEVAELVGRHRVTVHRWLSCYQKGGLSALLAAGPILGRPPKVPVEVAAKLQQELRDTEGFKSYGEVRLGLLALHDICVSYTTAYRLAHDPFGNSRIQNSEFKKRRGGNFSLFNLGYKPLSSREKRTSLFLFKAPDFRKMSILNFEFLILNWSVAT